MSKELMIERIEKAQKEIEAKREKIQQGRGRRSIHRGSSNFNFLFSAALLSQVCHEFEM